MPTLIEALIGGKLGFAAARDPLALAAATLYLPTRRACRLARDAFLEVLKDDAAILPRIVAIGDIDEDEIAFAEAATGDIAADALALPEAVGRSERRLLLTQLITTWATSPELHGVSGAPLVAQTPAAACALADDLARLIDDMTTRGVPWERLDDLVPDELDEYWQLTLKFLQIAIKQWPEVLHERGVIEAVTRRDLLIKAEAARLARKTDAPVIAAGSTGSIPATAELIATIARLPHGAVVLPGLDTDLDEESWKLIAGDESKRIAPASGHPQFAMQALLDAHRHHARCRRKPGRRRTAASGCCRRRCGRRPRPTCGGKKPPSLRSKRTWTTALETLTVIEAANAEEESLAIAVALREAVHDGKTAALVTPDRALGRRVLAALARWNIAAEDSGGDALAETPAGIFARLAAETALARLCPGHAAGAAQTSAAAARHGRHRRRRRHARARDFARAASTCWNARLGPRAKNISHELEKFRRKEKIDLHPSDPRRALTDAELAAAADLVARLGEALAPFESLGRTTLPLSELAARHRDVLAALSRQGKDEVAFAGRDGAKLADALDELAASTAAARLLVEPPDYLELFSAALAGRVVRRAAAARHARAHPRAARSAAHRKRPRRARRPGRRNLAAGKPDRCLAQPPDAAQPRPRSAGAPHRPFGARLCAIARRPRRDPDARRQDRRHADRAVALHPAPRRGRRRALESTRASAATIISPGRASSTGPRQLRRSRSRRRNRRARHGRRAFR